jgi:predicted AAA+ superfamily ATPase
VAHDRLRQMKDYYQKLAHFSPIVGIFGHRQVGKSTFMASQVKEYCTLDDVAELERAGLDPKGFISKRAHPFGIDECQLEPKLFPTLKEKVRTDKRPGQFILSGSVRFTSRKTIRESLAGRLAFLEVLPFSVSEIREEPLPETVVKLIGFQRFTETSLEVLRPALEIKALRKYFLHYLHFGGLPGLCFIRNEQLRANRLKQLHELIIDRDLRMVTDTKLSIKTLLDFLEELAKNAWLPYNGANITRKFKFSPVTQKKLIYAFESIFLIRRIPLIGRKGEIILMEDQFEEWSLSRHGLEPIKQIQGALYRNIRTQWMYRLTDINKIESYLTHDNARVDLVISSNENVLGLKVIEGEKPNLSEKRSVTGFLRKFSNSKIIYLSESLAKPEVIDERSLCCSIYSVI